MDSDNSVKKLLNILEPLISDLDDQKKHLEEKKDELENVSRFLAYTKDNYEMVGIYADQDLITSKFSELKLDSEEYKACCYLLKSEDESVKCLPQYEKAVRLIGDIIEFFVQYKAQLLIDIQDLNNVCQRKEFEKKYYDILSNPKLLIEDVEEFRELIDTHELNDDEKIKILIYTLKNNIINYESGNK